MKILLMLTICITLSGCATVPQVPTKRQCTDADIQFINSLGEELRNCGNDGSCKFAIAICMPDCNP